MTIFTSFRDFAGAMREGRRRNLQCDEIATAFPYTTAPQKRVRSDVTSTSWLTSTGSVAER
ncbi:hypothetical protein [Cyclobacterium sediminis]